MPLILRPSPSVAEQSALAAARSICRKHLSDLYFASFFLPRRKRDAALAVGAFCWMTWEAIDAPAEESSSAPAPAAGCCSTSSLEERLHLYRQRLDGVYAGQLCLPDSRGEERARALYAFGLMVQRHEIPKQHFLDLAHGRKMQLTIRRYATWAALEQYCHYTGGIVATILAAVLALTHSAAREQIAALGIAMRFTHILRDVGQDWEHGRVFLPLEDLAQFRYSERDLAAGAVNDKFRELMRFEIVRARELYQRGAEGLCWLAGDGSRLATATLTVFQSGILNEIERNRYDVLNRPVVLTTGQKLRRLPKAWQLAQRQPDEPLPRLQA